MPKFYFKKTKFNKKLNLKIEIKKSMEKKKYGLGMIAQQIQGSMVSSRRGS